MCIKQDIWHGARAGEGEFLHSPLLEELKSLELNLGAPGVRPRDLVLKKLTKHSCENRLAFMRLTCAGNIVTAPDAHTLRRCKDETADQRSQGIQMECHQVQGQFSANEWACIEHCDTKPCRRIARW